MRGARGQGLRRGLLVALLCALAGCGGTPRQDGDAATEQTSAIPLSATGLLVRSSLLAQMRAWKGVPYRLGGTDRRGLDCSAFAQITYRERFGIDIPRDTEAQRGAGMPVAVREALPGDLLFFDTGVRTRHVGIYAGQRQFLHVSTRAGVMLSSLLEPYWAGRLEAVVRVVSP